MDINGDLGVAVLPVARGRVLRGGVLPGRGPGARPGLHAGLERLAPRCVGRDLSRAHHPPAAALAGRHRPGHRRGAAQRRAGLQGGELPRVPRPPSASRPSSRGSGTPSSPPARRPRRWSASTREPRRGRRSPSPAPPFELLPTLFPVNALIAAAEWLWSGVPLRFPDLNVAMSEGGIGWVPMLIDRVDYVLSHSASGTEIVGLALGRSRPARCCGATSGSAPSTTRRSSTSATGSGSTTSCWRATIPTPTRRWPDTQAVLQKTLGHLPDDELRKIAGGNAARPVPPPHATRRRLADDRPVRTRPGTGPGAHPARWSTPTATWSNPGRPGTRVPERHPAPHRGRRPRLRARRGGRQRDPGRPPRDPGHPGGALRRPRGDFRSLDEAWPGRIGSGGPLGRHGHRGHRPGRALPLGGAVFLGPRRPGGGRGHRPGLQRLAGRLLREPTRPAVRRRHAARAGPRRRGGRAAAGPRASSASRPPSSGPTPVGAVRCRDPAYEPDLGRGRRGGR